MSSPEAHCQLQCLHRPPSQNRGMGLTGRAVGLAATNGLSTPPHLIPEQGRGPCLWGRKEPHLPGQRKAPRNATVVRQKRGTLGLAHSVEQLALLRAHALLKGGGIFWMMSCLDNYIDVLGPFR